MTQPPQWTPLPPAQGVTPPPYYGGVVPQALAKPSSLYKVLGIIMLCFGIAGAFWALFSIASVLLLTVYTSSHSATSLMATPTIIFGCARSAMAFITGTLLAVSGFGVMRAKKWSRLLSLGYAALSLFDTLAGTAINVFVIQPKTLAAFGGSTIHGDFMLMTYVVTAFGVLIASAVPVVVIVAMASSRAKQELDV